MILRILLITILLAPGGISSPTLAYDVGSVIELDVSNRTVNYKECSICYLPARAGATWRCSLQKLPAVVLISFNDSLKGLIVTLECSGMRWNTTWSASPPPYLSRLIFSESNADRLRLALPQQLFLVFIFLLLIWVLFACSSSRFRLADPCTPAPWTVIVHTQGRIKTAQVPPGFCLTRATLDEFVRRNRTQVQYAAMCT